MKTTVEMTVEDYAAAIGATPREAYAIVAMLRRTGRASRIGHFAGPSGHPRVLWQLPVEVVLRVQRTDGS